MSHQPGQVIFGPGIQAHFEYNGTVDIAHSPIYLTQEELRRYWRTDRSRYCEENTHTHTPCWLYSSYGGGFFWYGEVCMQCMCITQGIYPNHPNGPSNEWVDDHDGHPIWGETDWGLRKEDQIP